MPLDQAQPSRMVPLAAPYVVPHDIRQERLAGAYVKEEEYVGGGEERDIIHQEPSRERSRRQIPRRERPQEEQQQKQRQQQQQYQPIRDEVHQRPRQQGPPLQEVTLGASSRSSIKSSQTAGYQQKQHQAYQGRHDSKENLPEQANGQDTKTKRQQPARLLSSKQGETAATSKKESESYNLDETLSFINSFDPATIMTLQASPETKGPVGKDATGDATKTEDDTKVSSVPTTATTPNSTPPRENEKKKKEERPGEGEQLYPRQIDSEQQHESLLLQQQSPEATTSATPFVTPEQEEAVSSLDDALSFINSFDPKDVLPPRLSEDSKEDIDSPTEEEAFEGNNNYDDDKEGDAAKVNLISEF